MILHGADRKSTRLNSSHLGISYAVFCLKKQAKSDGLCSPPASHVNVPPRAARSARPPDSTRQRARLLRGAAQLRQPLCFFFLKDAPPPDFSPFPPHAALPS